MYSKLVQTVFSTMLCLTIAAPGFAEPEPAEAEDKSAGTKRIRGKVVWLYDAVKPNFGIKTVPEATDRVLALETEEGHLLPILEDIRGRGFRRDKRLRGIEMELLVRQQPGLPFAQVIQVFALKPDGKYELDYWCEICAIAMFELKPCDCCQGDIELRERKVDE